MGDGLLNASAAIPIPTAKTAPTNWWEAMAAASNAAVATNAPRPPRAIQTAAAQHAHAPNPAATMRAYTPPLTLHVHLAIEPSAPSAAIRPPGTDLVATRTVP